jgi:hypothetical protein
MTRALGDCCLHVSDRRTIVICVAEPIRRIDQRHTLPAARRPGDAVIRRRN